MTRASLRPVCKTTTRSRNLNKKEGVHSLTPFIHQFWTRYQAPTHREWKWSAKGSGANPKNRLRSYTNCRHKISCPKMKLQLEERRSDILRDRSPNSGNISSEKTKRTDWREGRLSYLWSVTSRHKMTGYRAWTV